MRKLYITGLFFVLLGCSRFGQQSPPEPSKARWVCLAKQYTEILFALGADSNLVGVDLSSTYPEAAKKIPTVGYHRVLSAEGILATQPTLIIHDNNIGPEHVVDQLNLMAIPMKFFENKAEDLASTKALIKEIGAYVQQTPRAVILCQQLDTDWAELQNQVTQIQDSLRVLVVHYGQASNVYLPQL